MGAPSETPRAGDTVKVVARIRPLLPRETTEGCRHALDVEPGPDGSAGNVVTVQGLTHNNAFQFDRVLRDDSSPTVLHEEYVRPLVAAFLAGYNATVFAYGQTGAGKSFTMGTDVPAARLPDAAWSPVSGFVFDQIARFMTELHAIPGARVSMTCSFFEIYQDQIRDLLAVQPGGSTGGSPLSGSRPQTPRGRPRGIYIRDPDPQREVILVGLEEIKVHDASQLQQCLLDGTRKRSTAATNTNHHSSRSHALLVLNLQQELPGAVAGAPPTCLASKLYLVDLAGSERLRRSMAEGARLTEACSINSGLLALGNVIEALSEPGRKHIPYRDHLLTHILRHALGGNSQTLMVACLSPADVDLVESLNTLRYAARARMVRNTPQKNQASDAASANAAAMAALRRENEALRQQLEALVLQQQQQQTHDASGSGSATPAPATPVSAEASGLSPNPLSDEPSVASSIGADAMDGHARCPSCGAMSAPLPQQADFEATQQLVQQQQLQLAALEEELLAAQAELQETHSDLVSERERSSELEARCNGLTVRLHHTLDCNTRLEQQLLEVKQLAAEQLAAADAQDQQDPLQSLLDGEEDADSSAAHRHGVRRLVDLYQRLLQQQQEQQRQQQAMMQARAAAGARDTSPNGASSAKETGGLAAGGVLAAAAAFASAAGAGAPEGVRTPSKQPATQRAGQPRQAPGQGADAGSDAHVGAGAAPPSGGPGAGAGDGVGTAAASNSVLSALAAAITAAEGKATQAVRAAAEEAVAAAEAALLRGSSPSNGEGAGGGAAEGTGKLGRVAAASVSAVIDITTSVTLPSMGGDGAQEAGVCVSVSPKAAPHVFTAVLAPEAAGAPERATNETSGADDLTPGEGCEDKVAASTGIVAEEDSGACPPLFPLPAVPESGEQQPPLSQAQAHATPLSQPRRQVSMLEQDERYAGLRRALTNVLGNAVSAGAAAREGKPSRVTSNGQAPFSSVPYRLSLAGAGRGAGVGVRMTDYGLHQTLSSILLQKTSSIGTRPSGQGMLPPSSSGLPPHPEEGGPSSMPPPLIQPVQQSSHQAGSWFGPGAEASAFRSAFQASPSGQGPVSVAQLSAESTAPLSAASAETLPGGLVQGGLGVQGAQEGGQAGSESRALLLHVLEGVASESPLAERVAAVERNASLRAAQLRREAAVAARRRLAVLSAVALPSGAETSRRSASGGGAAAGAGPTGGGFGPGASALDVETWLVSVTQDSEVEVLIQAERAARAELQQQLELDSQRESAAAAEAKPAAGPAEAREQGAEAAGDAAAVAAREAQEARRAALSQRLAACSVRIGELLLVQQRCRADADAQLSAAQQAPPSHTPHLPTRTLPGGVSPGPGLGPAAGPFLTKEATTALMVAAANLRRHEMELQAQVLQLQQRVAVKEELSQLYMAEAEALARKLSVTEGHAAELEASNTRLGVLAAQRHEAVTLMVAARLAQADAEEQARRLQDDLDSLQDHIDQLAGQAPGRLGAKAPSNPAAARSGVGHGVSPRGQGGAPVSLKPEMELSQRSWVEADDFWSIPSSPINGSFSQAAGAGRQADRAAAAGVMGPGAAAGGAADARARQVGRGSLDESASAGGPAAACAAASGASWSSRLGFGSGSKSRRGSLDQGVSAAAAARAARAALAEGGEAKARDGSGGGGETSDREGPGGTGGGAGGPTEDAGASGDGRDPKEGGWRSRMRRLSLPFTGGPSRTSSGSGTPQSRPGPSTLG